MNNSDIIPEILLGNQSAFTKLVREYKTLVYNLCFRFLLQKEDAEDISQEVFIEIFYSLKNFKGKSQLSTWIYRITVSKCLDELKKRKRQKNIQSIGALLGIDLYQDLLKSEDRPDSILESKQNIALIENAMSKLPENQRIALTLSKFDQLSNSKVAEIMNLTSIAVDSLIYRAKKNLEKTKLEC